MPTAASTRPPPPLHIFGGAATPTLRAYMGEVRRLAEKSGVAHAVRLMPNAPRREINAAMDRARAFFHATINEHWGIAVAEAMARGLPPVVHKSGGTWSDLAQGAGLGYTSPEEAVEQLAKLLTDPKAWKAASAASVAKAKGLTLDAFAKKLADLVSAI